MLCLALIRPLCMNGTENRERVPTVLEEADADRSQSIV